MNLLLIFLGGGLGATLRYTLSSLVNRTVGNGFPWGTLAVNLLGALAMGMIVEMLALKWSAPGTVRLFLTTGILGGFTTFSAFSLESALMFQRGDWVQLSLYIAVSVIGTIALLMAGMHMVRTVF